MAADRAMARRANGVVEMPDRRGVGRKSMSDFDPGQEFDRAELGDRRRTARVVKVAGQLAKEAERSLPGLMSSGDLEGAYRLLSNEAVDYQRLFAAHADRVAERSAGVGRVFVIHDTTELAFPLRGGQLREGLSKLSTNRQGFYLHSSLVVADDESRCPLGTIAAQAYVHRSQLSAPEALAFWKKRHGLFDNEHDRWLAGVQEAERRLAGSERGVHLCDREGDSYPLLSTLVARGHQFVIRLTHDRQVQSYAGLLEPVSEALAWSTWRRTTRTLPVAARQGDRSDKDKRANPDRPARIATLSFRSRRVGLLRPENQAAAELPARVDVNLVEVLERTPPPGQEPVRWVLATSLPVNAVADVLAVVDAYRKRWVIEEWHKAIKTGCAYEKRQLESAHALLNLLVLTLPVATDLMLLRHLADEQPDTPADRVFSELELAVLAVAVAGRLKLLAKPTILQVRDAIAALGGHLKRNGAPGWITLLRGYVELRSLVEGARIGLALAGRKDGAEKM